MIACMNTAQKNNYSKSNCKTLFRVCYGFEAFRRRIAEQLSIQGQELSEEDDSVLFDFYRNGENETYVLAAFGYEC